MQQSHGFQEGSGQILELEEQLKKRDPGMTRGELVILVQEKLGILTTLSNIKDGKQRLGDARWKNDESLLAVAQEMVGTWFSKLST